MLSFHWQQNLWSGTYFNYTRVVFIFVLARLAPTKRKIIKSEEQEMDVECTSFSE
jgi:hypothetical protein